MSRRRFGPAVAAAGFTLLEVMVVVVILGILATITVTQLSSRAGQARVSICRTKLKGMEEAVEMFKLDYGKYPDKIEDLINPPPDAQGNKRDSYLRGDQTPNDPWNHPFIYNRPGSGGKAYEILSYGANGDAGGTGEDADISNWDVK